MNPFMPKVVVAKFSLAEIRTFLIKIRNFKLWEMPKLSNFRFPEAYFFNCDNTELKRSSKTNFSVCERHRWAVEGEILQIFNSKLVMNKSNGFHYNCNYSFISRKIILSHYSKYFPLRSILLQAYQL